MDNQAGWSDDWFSEDEDSNMSWAEYINQEGLIMDFNINQHDSGDWEVSPTSFDVTSNLFDTLIHSSKQRTFMTGTKKDFILLSPLQPSIFGYRDHEVSRMITELNDVGILVMLVDTGPEMLFYARASKKSTLEALCTSYDIGGILVEAAAVYDQVEIGGLAL